MGKIADLYCDIIYLTDDNPRNENPNFIRREIKKGIKRNKVHEIPDRKYAIKNAIHAKNFKSEAGFVIERANKPKQK